MLKHEQHVVQCFEPDHARPTCADHARPTCADHARPTYADHASEKCKNMTARPNSQPQEDSPNRPEKARRCGHVRRMRAHPSSIALSSSRRAHFTVAFCRTSAPSPWWLACSAATPVGLNQICTRPHGNSDRKHRPFQQQPQKNTNKHRPQQ
jgi:hypothetical protein